MVAVTEVRFCAFLIPLEEKLAWLILVLLWARQRGLLLPGPLVHETDFF